MREPVKPVRRKRRRLMGYRYAQEQEDRACYRRPARTYWWRARNGRAVLESDTSCWRRRGNVWCHEIVGTYRTVPVLPNYRRTVA